MKLMRLAHWRRAIGARPQTRVVIVLPPLTKAARAAESRLHTAPEALFDVAVYSAMFSDQGAETHWQRQLIDRQISHERLAQLLNSELGRLDQASGLTLYCLAQPGSAATLTHQASRDSDPDTSVSLDPTSLQQSLQRPCWVSAEIFEPWQRLVAHLGCGLHCSLSSQWQVSTPGDVRQANTWLDALSDNLQEQDWPGPAVALTATEWRLLQSWRSTGLGDEVINGWPALRQRLTDVLRYHWEQQCFNLVSLLTGALLGGGLAGLLIGFITASPAWEGPARSLETLQPRQKSVVNTPFEPDSSTVDIATLDRDNAPSDSAQLDQTKAPHQRRAGQSLPWPTWTKQLRELSLSRRAEQQGLRPHVLWLDMRVRSQGDGLETWLALSSAPEDIPDGCRYQALAIHADTTNSLHQLHCISRTRSSQARKRP